MIGTHIRLTCVSCTLLLTLGLAANVRGAMADYPFSRHLQLGDNLPEGGDVVSFFVPKFDPALGSLQSVVLTLDSAFQGGVTFYHPTLTLDYTYTPSHYVVADFPDLGSAPDLAIDRALPSQTHSAKLWQPTSSDLFQAMVVINSQDLPQFQGPGQFQVTLTIEDRSTYLSSNPLAYINDKYVISDATFTATYTYDPVPEPASFTLLGISGLLILRRRRPCWVPHSVPKPCPVGGAA